MSEQFTKDQLEARLDLLIYLNGVACETQGAGTWRALLGEIIEGHQTMLNGTSVVELPRSLESLYVWNMHPGDTATVELIDGVHRWVPRAAADGTGGG